MSKDQNGLGVSEEGTAYTLDGTGAQAVAGAGQGQAHDPPPDGPRYAACGNAVTVNVAEWIGERLMRFA